MKRSTVSSGAFAILVALPLLLNGAPVMVWGHRQRVTSPHPAGRPTLSVGARACGVSNRVPQAETVRLYSAAAFAVDRSQALWLKPRR